MRQYAVLRLLLACFLLYFAWPYIPDALTSVEKIFWGAWLLFFALVVGGNLATLLHLSRPPVMEQQKDEKQRVQNR